MVKKVMLTRPARDTHVASFVKNKKNSEKGAPSIPPLRGGYIDGPISENQKKEKKQGVEDLMAAASLLTASERKQLLAKLALGQQVSADGQSRDVDMWAQGVYEGLVAALGHGDGAALGPMVVKRLVGATAAWQPVAEFMAASGLDKLKVVERQSVYMMLAALVVERAKYVAAHSNAPLGPKLVGSCAANIAAIFDAAFPGYLASGLAHLVAKQLVAAR